MARQTLVEEKATAARATGLAEARIVRSQPERVRRRSAPGPSPAPPSLVRRLLAPAGGELAVPSERR